MKYLMCNFKANFTLNEAVSHAEKIKQIAANTFRFVVFPSTVYLPYFDGINYALGAQDVSSKNSPSYTGEINAKQLYSSNVKYVLIAHSERRINFNETETIIVDKISNALAEKLKVVYCLGETKEEYDRHKTYVVIEKQIARIFNEIKSDLLKNIIIAYEPIWAIGSGKTPSIREIEEMILFIKKLVKEYYTINIEVIYGGSVDDENVNALKTIKSLDGLLVGTSSLDIKKLNKIVDYLK